MLGVFAGEYLCGSQDCRRLAGLQGLGERMPGKSTVLAFPEDELRYGVHSSKEQAHRLDVLDGEVKLTSSADPATTCTYWMSDGGSLLGHNGVYTFLEGGTYEIVQTIVDDLGCTATAHAEVAVNGTIFFAPTGFTPDGNGLNDVWLPVATGTTLYELLVFNRWGEVVWSTNDPKKPWLGSVHEGTHYAPDGMYLWSVLLYDQLGYPRTYSGTVFMER
jgi:gliding motility-associated-like protein